MILGTEGSHSSDYQLSVHTGYLTVKGEAEHYLWGSCLWAGTLRVHAHVLQNMGMSWSDLYWNDDGSFYRIKRCLRISERCIKKRKESRFDEGTEACAIPCTSRSFFSDNFSYATTLWSQRGPSIGDFLLYIMNGANKSCMCMWYSRIFMDFKFQMWSLCQSCKISSLKTHLQ